MNKWQFDQLGCECPIHRYHVAHLCACGRILDHGQGTWDAHRTHDMIGFDPTHYKHGWAFTETFDYLEAMGFLNVFDPMYPAVYEKAAELV